MSPWPWWGYCSGATTTSVSDRLVVLLGSHTERFPVPRARLTGSRASRPKSLAARRAWPGLHLHLRACDDGDRVCSACADDGGVRAGSVWPGRASQWRVVGGGWRVAGGGWLVGPVRRAPGRRPRRRVRGDVVLDHHRQPAPRGAGRTRRHRHLDGVARPTAPGVARARPAAGHHSASSATAGHPSASSATVGHTPSATTLVASSQLLLIVSGSAVARARASRRARRRGGHLRVSRGST